MKALITADLHLTSRPVDEYRWEIFKWLRTNASNRQVDTIFLLGDLTDRKDEHDSLLVNRLVTELRSLTKICPVHAIMGNHDYVEPSAPFFKFLNRIHGLSFYNEVTDKVLFGKRILFIPHLHNYRVLECKYGIASDFSMYDIVFFHQPIKGAKTSNGSALKDGFGSGRFDSAKGFVIGGDVHIPQQVGKAVYVGSPYPIRFGDDFTPRIGFLSGERLVFLPRYTIKKMIVHIKESSELKEAGINPDDMVRVVVDLPREDYYRWKEIEKEVNELAKEMKFKLCGLQLATPKEDALIKAPKKAEIVDAETIVRKFVQSKGLKPSSLRMGLSLLAEE